MPQLHYDQEHQCFWYSANGAVQVPGALKMGMTKYAFLDEYPRNARIITEFIRQHKTYDVTDAALLRMKEILAQEKALSKPVTASNYAELFRMKPYDHQAKAIEYMMVYPKLMLVLEQGLGKTFISYMATRIWKEKAIPHRALIVCPRIVLPNWLREVSEYTDMRILPYYGSQKDRAKCYERLQHEDWDMVVTTFDMLIQSVGGTKGMYQEMLEALGDRRQYWVEKWLSHEKITTDEAEVILADSKKGSEIIRARKIDLRLLPTAIIKNIKASEDPLQQLLALPWDNLIVDEASRCLNPTSKRSKAVEALADRAKRKYLLSGTLCVGRPTDLYMPSNILDKSIIGMNWWNFQHTFCVYGNMYNQNIVTGYKNVPRLKAMVDPYILSMKREECLDLPERIIQERYYELSPKQVRLYDDIVFNSWTPVEGDVGIQASLVIQKNIRLFQVLSGFVNLSYNCTALCGTCEKILECMDRGIMPNDQQCINQRPIADAQRRLEFDTGKLSLLEEDLEDLDGEKAIIWAWYRYDLAHIAEFLKKKGIGFVTADTKDCDKIFNEDKTKRVFLGQTRQGIGITLNSAATMIYYSHGPDLEARLQSMDRNYRIGQQRSVVVHDYVCRGTIEENLLKLLSHKELVKDVMQAKTGCMYCEKFASCLSGGKVNMKDVCPHHEAMGKAQRKVKMGLGHVHV